MSKNPVRLLVLSVLILAVLSFPQMIPKAHAVPGVVCVGPDLPAQTACPAPGLALTGPVTTGPSTQISVQVFIQVTDPMNGFDVTLLAPHAFLVPVGVDLTGTILGTGPTVLLECLQGVLKAGSVCSASDTVDTLHFAVVAAAGAGLTAPGASGILFTAIYNIVGAAPAGTVIGFQNDANDGLTNCAAASVPGTCISISNGTAIPNSETAQTGTFPSTATQPAIQLSPNGGNLGTILHTQPIPPQTVTATDTNGYAATVQTDATITYTISVSGPTSSSTGVGATITPTSFDFNVAAGPNAASLTITAASTATLGTWSVSVTGLYHFDPTCAGVAGTCIGVQSTLLETVTYTFTLADFGFTGSPAIVPYWCPATAQSPVTGASCPAGHSGSSTLTVTPQGFTGTVTISTGTITPATTPALNVAYTVTSIPGASGTSTVTFSLGVLRPAVAVTGGAYIVSIRAQGTVGTFTRTQTISVSVRPQNFNITTSNGTPTGPAITFASGSSATDTLTIGSLPSGALAVVNNAGFAGPVTLSSTITGGSGLIVTPTTSPVTLTAGMKLTDVVTFSGTVAVTTPFTVTITGTATSATSTPSTQTQSVTYSVTITVVVITHPTSTAVNCVPSSITVSVGTVCTATVTDTSGAGATTPTGTIALTSTGTGTFSSSGSCGLIAGATGTASCSVTYTPSVVGTGTHSITGSYGGDATHATSQGTFALTVTQPAAVTITTTLSATTINVGGSVTDAATLSGNTAAAGGTVTYRFFTGSTCSGTGTVVGSPVAVINGVVTSSSSQTFNTAGSFSWNAAYSGDANNAAATSACEPLTVNQATTSISTTLSAISITAGGTVTDSATLTGGFQASGTVTYNFFAGSTCAGTPTVVGTPVTVSAGVVPNSAAQTFPTAGSFSLNAVYSGDTNNKAATSACEPLTVNPSIVTVTISTNLNPNPAVVGGSVADSATLAGNTATAGGTVTYNLFTTAGCTGTSAIVSTVTVVNGVVPNSSHTFTSVAPASWNAVYSGDAGNSAATSTCEPLTVNKASPTITTTLSATSIAAGGSVTDSATLASGFQAGGTATYSFFTGQTCAGTGTVVGSPVTVTGGVVPSSVAHTFASAGSFSWNAVYSGDANNNGATSSCELLTVNPASGVVVATTLSASSIAVGGSVTDSATLTGIIATAGGTVTYSFFTGATCTGTATPVGTPVTVVTGVVPISASHAFNIAGSYSWNAIYSGDANNVGATSGCEPLTVNKASPTITTSLSATQITVGGSVHDSATMTGGFQAGGLLGYNLFTNGNCKEPGSTLVGSVVTVTNGVIPDSIAHTFNTAGAFSWNVSYSGDANNNQATSPCELLTVNQATPTIATSLSSNSITVGASVLDTATLTNSFQAGGTVTYNVFNGPSCLGTGTPLTPVVVSNGVVSNSPSQTFNSAGSFSWNAIYSGDTNNQGATSGCEPLTVNKANPTLATTVSASSIPAGGSVFDSATLTGGFQAGGTVTYFVYADGSCGIGRTVVGTPVTVTNGVVPNSASQTFPNPGSFSWNASYSGDNNNLNALSACEPLTVTPSQVPAIATSLSSSTITVGGSITDSATLSGVTATAGGTVTYKVFATIDCSGTATIVGSPVTVTNGVVPNSASHTFTAAAPAAWNAVYSGDASNAAATSSCEPLTVNMASPAIATSLSATQILAGGSVTDSATLTSSFQAGGTVSYRFFTGSTCTGTASLVGSPATVTNGVVPNSASQAFNTAGSFSWNALYSGDGNNNGAVSGCEPLTVLTSLRTTTTTVTCIPASINFGSITTCTALVNDTDTGTGIVPTGTVTFTSSGTGTFTGSPCTISRPAGFVVPIATCQSTYTPTGTTARIDVITGSYGGDANHLTSSGTFSVNVQVVPLHTTTTTVSCVPNPVTIGQLSSCTATVTDTSTSPTTPTGTVSFTPGGVCNLASISSSAAACSISLIPIASGTIAVTAMYSGDTTHSVSSGNTNLATSLRMPTVSVACTPASVLVNQPTTCTATVADTVAGTASIPTGTVIFTPGGTCTLSHSISDPNAESTCSVNITPTAPGQLTIFAVYSGDSVHSSNQGSTTINVTQPVVKSTSTRISCSPSTVTVGSPTICTANVTDTSGTPTTSTGTVSFTSDSNGSFSNSGSCSLSTATTASATCSLTYTPNNIGSGNHTITGSYNGDSTHSTSSGTFHLRVTQPSGQPVQLTFSAFDIDDFDNGVGQLQVFVNGHLVVDIPAGLNHLSGSGDYAPYTNRWVNFGPFDITSFVVQGQNTIVFTSPPPGHFGLIKNVTIVQGTVLLLHVKGVEFVSLSHPVTFTFSIPPLVITSFTASNTSPKTGDNVTFTATYTGGTAPFKCVFSFGDEESVRTIGTAGSCSVTHDFDDAGRFTARVTVIGSSTSDRVSSALNVTVVDPISVPQTSQLVSLTEATVQDDD